MGLKNLIDNWNISTSLFFIQIQFLRLMRKAGFKTRKDPWRYTTRVYHHLDYCSFGLAAFNLSPPGIELMNDKAHIVSQLGKFLRQHPIIQKKLEWSRYSVNVVPNDFMDIILAEFDKSNRLQAIQFFPELSKSTSLDQVLIEKLSIILIDEYNNFRFESDETRPRLLKESILKRAKHQDLDSDLENVKILLERMLAAVFVHFEMDSSGGLIHNSRFRVPKFFQMRPFGLGSLNIHVRILPEKKVDIWIQFNHAVTDGEPAAVIVNDLENKWKASPVKFTKKQLNQINTDDCIDYQCRIKLCIISGILNFEKIVSFRRKLQLLFQRELDSPLTIVGLILWGLGQTNTFRDTKFLIPINLPKNEVYNQTVGLLYIRPGKYVHPTISKNGFVAFQNEFNKQIVETRLRTSEQYKAFEIFSLLPHLLYLFSCRYQLKPLQEIIGSSVISVLKSPSFFAAPYASTKTGAAIAIGNIKKGVSGNEYRGAFSIKGPVEKSVDYGKSLSDVVENFDKYVPFFNTQNEVS